MHPKFEPFIILGGLLFISALYIFPRIIIQYEKNYLIIKRYIFWFLLFGMKKIAIEEIAKVEEFRIERDLLPGADIFGNLFWKKGVLIRLRKGFCPRVYITPLNPGVFITDLREKIVEIKGHAHL